MRNPRIVFQLKSWRAIEGGGTDKAGNYRGVEIQKLSKGEWKFMFFRARQTEAESLIREMVLEGKKPTRPLGMSRPL